MSKEPTEIELWAAWAWSHIPAKDYDDFLRRKIDELEAKKMTAADIGLDGPIWSEPR